MANGFHCGMCGWQERLHISLSDFPEEDRPLLSEVTEGFTCSFDDCSGYFVTKEEAGAVAAELEAGGPHEGCH